MIAGYWAPQVSANSANRAWAAASVSTGLRSLVICSPRLAAMEPGTLPPSTAAGHGLAEAGSDEVRLHTGLPRRLPRPRTQGTTAPAGPLVISRSVIVHSI